jgi:hypothetical protein
MNLPVVVLYACTLYPAALRDVLMRLALHRLILARWTDAIHDEWIEAVLRNRLRRTRFPFSFLAPEPGVTGCGEAML